MKDPIVGYIVVFLLGLGVGYFLSKPKITHEITLDMKLPKDEGKPKPLLPFLK